MQFRKKPVVIEAVQWFQMGDHPAVVMKSEPTRYADAEIPWIATLEGGHVVTPGDWIITGVKGECYPCKPDIFAMTYEPAATPATSDKEARVKDDGWLPLEGADRKKMWMVSDGRLVAMAHYSGQFWRHAHSEDPVCFTPTKYAPVPRPTAPTEGE